MAVTLADIKKLRDITGAGMMDVKKALTEANGDFEIAKDLLRKRGQAIAAKRSDREASEGCVLAKAENGFGVIVGVKCETDFVAKNADFVGMVKLILDAAFTNRPANLEELKALKIGDFTAQDLVTERSGVTGEKMELSDYTFLEGDVVDAYNHLGNKLSSLVAANAGADHETVHGISMQVAAMAPIALDADHVAEEVKAKELAVAIEKTKQDEINKAVEQELRKAGLNPAHCDSDDHIASNTAKGWLTEEQAEIARGIRANVPAQAEANLKGIIADLDKAMKETFAEKFQDIQNMFAKVFKELFGGGKASLTLVDEENILESGVIINAQPPGKKLQNMMQLSGGEKSLTAISLLFAIQSLKPSPFCILDEIEAALDDANVGHFAHYLDRLTKHTQFIVITHRKGTMEAANRLYGITMQEKGVSTLVSVNLIEDDLDD